MRQCPCAPVPTQAASTVSVTVVSGPPCRLWSAVAAAGSGARGAPAATCHVLQASSSMRPSRVATALTRTSSALATTASRLRQRSMGSQDLPKGPPPPPWLFITWVGCGGPDWPSELVAIPLPTHVPTGHLHSGRQLCRAFCTTCESGSWALGGDSNEATRSDYRSAVVVEITGTSKSPLPKPSAGFIGDRRVSTWGWPLGGRAWPLCSSSELSWYS